jgi:NAD-dependent DNA ligase
LFSPVNASGEKNREILARLKSHNLPLAVSAATLAGQTSILSGNTFVVSGVFTKISRTELKKALKIMEVKSLAVFQVKQHMWLLEIIWALANKPKHEP